MSNEATEDPWNFVSNEHDVPFNDISRNRVEQQKVWMDEDLIPIIKRNFKDDKISSFRVLSVGPSLGKFDLVLMEELKRLRDESFNPEKISWTAVEPNKTALDKFKEKAEGEEMKGYFDFTWINKTFEEYMKDGDAKDKFHFVHFVNVFFYMEEEVVIKDTLEKLLLKNGVLLALVGTEGDIWTMLMDEFKHKIRTLSSELHYPTNAMLSRLADRNGWKYEIFNRKLDMEITEVFSPGDKNGISILQFFLQTKENPYDVYGSELIEEVVEFLRSKSWSKMNGENETFYVNDDDGIIIITK